MGGSVVEAYDALVAAKALEPSAPQRSLAGRLDVLGLALAEDGLKSKDSALGWIFARAPERAPVRGLYIFGSVGSGKTMLMDLFFEAAPVKRKRRVHFHAFMADVHERIGAHREALKRGAETEGDPIAPTATALAGEARLLCFDEFGVADIADAMILGRLFERLFHHGVTVVATSNTAPDDLYADGLNRALFLPFIALLKKNMDVVRLDAPKDYRRLAAVEGARYIAPLGEEAEKALSEHFTRLTGRSRGLSAEIRVPGRRIPVPEAAAGVARFSFADLCGQPLGAADYLRIARAYRTIVLSGIPLMSGANRDEAKRFINLIDTLYDSRVRLIASAEAEPEDLWSVGADEDGLEGAEFARTASRLLEMRSPDWPGERYHPET